MTLAVFTSVTGAPGVTSLAVGVATAWPTDERRVLIEADPDGGRLGAELGIGFEPGMVNLALAARTNELSAREIIDETAARVGDWYAVPGPPSAEQSHSTLTAAAQPIAATMAAAKDVAWIVDAGRMPQRSPAFAFAVMADLVVLVSHGSLAHLELLPHRVDVLKRAGCNVAAVVVEPTPWDSGEIADFAQCDVLATLPHVAARRSDLRGLRHRQWRPWWDKVYDVAYLLSASSSDAEVNVG